MFQFDEISEKLGIPSPIKYKFNPKSYPGYQHSMTGGIALIVLLLNMMNSLLTSLYIMQYSFFKPIYCIHTWARLLSPRRYD
jgi:hypothetical protein